MKTRSLFAIGLLTTAALSVAGTVYAFGKESGFVTTPLDDVTLTVVDKAAGKGNVLLKRRLTGKTLESFTAYSGGGVDAQLANVGTDGGQKGVVTMQEEEGKFLKVYTREGELLASRKVSSSEEVHEYDAGKMVRGDDENYIVAARQTGDEQILVLVYTYDEENREFDRVTSKTVTELDSEQIDEDFGVVIVKKKLRLLDEDEDTMETLELDGNVLE